MRISIIAFSCCFLICAGAFAQTTAVSQISGTVQDSTGSAIPGAEVQVKQTDTGFTRTTTTGPDGGYALPNLPVGPYQLQVTKEGFSAYGVRRLW